MLACSETGQTAMELVLGEPDADHRREVIYRDGIPMLRQRPAGEGGVTRWPGAPITLPLDPPGNAGEDRLKLRFSINAAAELTVSWEDLSISRRYRLEPTQNPVLSLGMVR